VQVFCTFFLLAICYFCNMAVQGFSQEFVFAWVVHPCLGNIIEAFAIKRFKSGDFGYGFQKFSLSTYYDYFPDASSAQKEILALCERFSDDNLQKKFRPGNTKSRTFFQDLPEGFVEEHIRPYIDRKLYEIVGLLEKHNIALYYKGEKNEPVREKPFEIKPGYAEAVFVFHRLPDETHYWLELQYQGERMDLNQSNAYLLSDKPCLLKIQDCIYKFSPAWDGKKLKPFFTKDYIVVPKQTEKKYFQRFVMGAVKDYPVIAKGFSLTEINEPPKALLCLESNWRGHWVLQLYFRYQMKVMFHAYETGEHVKVHFREVNGDFEFKRIFRNLAAERPRIEMLRKMGLYDRNSEGFYLDDPGYTSSELSVLSANEWLWKIVEWLGFNQVQLEENGFEIDQQTGLTSFFIGLPEISFSLREKTDWFDLHAEVEFGDYKFPFMRLRSFILNSIREFPLPDGTIGLIPSEWFEKYQDVFRFASEGQHGEMIIKKHHFPLLSNIADQGIKVPEISTGIEKFECPSIPGNFLAELRGYQMEGFRWLCFLYENNLGGCLADDMGLGKTIQTLAVLAMVHQDDKHHIDQLPVNIQGDTNNQFDLFSNKQKPVSVSRASLLVMPLSLVHNWIQEINRFVPWLKILQHTGPMRAASCSAFSGYHAVITTYGTLRSDIGMLSEYVFRYIILDESQAVKNPESRVFQAVKSLRGQHRLVLTGTPIENSLTDLWSQFSFLNPGMLGSMSFFKKQFVVPVEKQKDKKQGKKLKALVEPFILRRTKEQVAHELPSLTMVTRYCEMPTEHHKLYDARKSQVRNLIMQQLDKQGLVKSRFLILSSLMKLRMLANHPLLTELDYQGESGKFNQVISHLEKLIDEGHKVLVFSQFVKHLNIFREYFDKHAISYSYLTGRVSGSDRKAVIDEFQKDPSRQVFLISIKAGGVGLNLTSADYVFILDPWWNPAVELQAINRAHRIGQDKKVFVYKFITRQTVEEKILTLQQKKSDLADVFIQPANALQNIQREDLEELIG
jgi:superfamily II DNA or RNA helicase